MRRRRRDRREDTGPGRATPTTSLVTKFASTSLVLLAALGAVLGLQLHRMIENRARSEAERMGTVATRLVTSAVTSSTPSSQVAQSQQLGQCRGL